MGYRIGSFNCLHLGMGTSKDVSTIARLICDEKMDIVALQEVHGKNGLQRILRELNMNSIFKWDGAADNEVNDYAFVWNTQRIELAYNDKGKIYEPHIWKQYKLDKTFKQRKLIREPFFARFFAKDGAHIEIRLINVHIRYSKGKIDDSSDDNTPGAIQMRKNEFDILAKAIYPFREDKKYGYKNGRPAYTILLGDYNLSLDKPWTNSPYLPETIKIGDKCIQTFQDQLTTLKKNHNGESDESVRGYANNYDHFTYNINNEKSFKNVNVSIRKIDAVRSVYDDDFEKYRKNVSDHVPIVLELNLK